MRETVTKKTANTRFIWDGADGARLLLHVCCAPCESSVAECLSSRFRITAYYMNSCIFPKEEYDKRLSEVYRLCKIKAIDVTEGEYDHESFLAFASVLAAMPEGGERCRICMEQRLEATARAAAQGGFDCFATTLSVSPHKDAAFLNDAGERLSVKYGVKYLAADFKKQNGFLDSVRLSEKYGLYRQNYCGCEFSLKGRNQ